MDGGFSGVTPPDWDDHIAEVEENELNAANERIRLLEAELAEANEKIQYQRLELLSARDSFLLATAALIEANHGQYEDLDSRILRLFLHLASEHAGVEDASADDVADFLEYIRTSI